VSQAFAEHCVSIHSLLVVDQLVTEHVISMATSSNKRKLLLCKESWKLWLTETLIQIFLTNKNFMFISKQDTINEHSVSEQLSQWQVRIEESVQQKEFWKKQALCLPAVFVKNYAGLHWRMCQNQQRNYDLQMWFGYVNGSFNT
jgi:hypothetical protein